MLRTSHRTFSLALLALTVILPAVSPGQVNGADQYYPMSPGNIWQYRRADVYRINGTIVHSTVSYVLARVAGDTVLGNGMKYHMIRKSGLIDTMIVQRIDSVTGRIIGYCFHLGGSEYIVDSLPAPIGHWYEASPLGYWVDYSKVTGIDSQTYLGKRSLQRRSQGGFPEFHYFKQTLHEGLGLVTRTLGRPGDDMYPGHSTVDTLIYAKIDGKEYGTLLSVEENERIPQAFSLAQNYPNPFNPSTVIEYELLHSSAVTLTIYDMLGREAATLVNGQKEAGRHSVTWNASAFTAGVYLARMHAGNYSSTIKLVLLQ